MRRTDKEIRDRQKIEEIVRRASVCRLGMVDDGEPYIVPMNFGYRDGAFYFHSAKQGRKIGILKKNPRVCFELDIDLEISEGKTEACQWGARFKSVIGWGQAVFVTDPEAKREGLGLLMAHYAGEQGGGFSYSQAKLEKTAVIRVDVERMAGKES